MTAPRRTRRRQPIELTKHHVRVLLQGQVLMPAVLGEWIDASGNLDLDVIGEVWQRAGEYLLADWIAERPGTRPQAWWWFDAPEPDRRLLRGSDIRDRMPDWESHRRFGIVRCFGRPERDDPPVWESQPAYLDRHGLLTDGEREALGEFETEETVSF